jgi:MiaB/RimO family radical SAM methylthiotransferase
VRRRLDTGPVAPLKLASGCDRRCAFCAIPSFRGRFVSRRPADLVAEAAWLADQGARELLLVSENTTSYGKDLGDVRLLETLLPALAATGGIERVRLSYLQPAECRDSLLEVIASTPGVAAYLDLSFQHASGPVLRRMRRFGDGEKFLALLDRVRALAPAIGVRTNVICGFPGETRDDVAEVERFLTAARLDAVGVFGYSDEDGTEAAGLPGKVRRRTIARRVERITRLAEELTSQRAEDRIGEDVEVLVETAGGPTAEGRAAHQGPEDGTTTIRGLRRTAETEQAAASGSPAPPGLSPGDLVRARVVVAEGVDLVAELLDDGAASDAGAAQRTAR